jgi:DnaJ-class molecular chaperone
MADDKDKGTPEAVTPGTPGSGENVCRRCEGKGKLADGGACPDCNGTGKISTPIGGA